MEGGHFGGLLGERKRGGMRNFGGRLGIKLVF